MVSQHGQHVRFHNSVIMKTVNHSNEIYAVRPFEICNLFLFSRDLKIIEKNVVHFIGVINFILLIEYNVLMSCNLSKNLISIL